MDEQAERFRRETMKLLVMLLNSISVMDIKSNGGGAVGMLVALYKYKTGIISFDDTFAIIMFSSDFFLPLRRLGSFFHVAMNSVIASKKIFKFLDLKEEESKTEEISSNESFDIILKNVFFCFEKENVLKNIEFTIKSNEFIAFVGESGCGKTILSRILSGNLKKLFFYLSKNPNRKISFRN